MREFRGSCHGWWASLLLLNSYALAQSPYGLDSRPPIGPYLNGRMSPTPGTFPSVLSATGAFRDVRTLTPSSAVIPFTVNSPLWSDGAIKTRWMAVPNDGPPYTAGEQINFVPKGEWTFPNGTVFIKHFELTVNELTGAKKRLETRLLVRDANKTVYGVTYKWRADNSDADLLPGGLDEDIIVTNTTGQTRVQRWSYPSRADCLFCHNEPAKYVLGAKTHQLNGNFTYSRTGRTDNQLRTWAHLGLLNPAPSEAAIPTYLKSVAVTNPAAPIQHRMRSWIDANCSQCHRPGGFGPGYDARFYTPLRKQNLIDNYVKFRDLGGSLLYQRDSALGPFQMPPLAKNVVHEAAMAVLRQWVASPLKIISVNLHQDTNHLAVRFNSPVNVSSATRASDYSLDSGVSITKAIMGKELDTVILTTSPLIERHVYALTVQGVQDTAPSANTIWPYSRMPFLAGYLPNGVPSRSDFNRDGFTDYLLLNPGTGSSAIWYLRGNVRFASVAAKTLPAGWAIVAAADFDQNGAPDYLLANASTGQTGAWFLDNALFTRSSLGPTLPAGWQLIAADDFDDDGRPDYVLFNPTTRRTATWFLNGTSFMRAAFGPTLPAGWTLIDALDFDANSKPDYLIFNPTTRRSAIWYLNGTGFAGSAFGPTLPAGWTVMGASDFNSDAKPDYVLVQASTRRTAIWYLNGASYAGGVFGPTVPAGYNLAAP